LPPIPGAFWLNNILAHARLAVMAFSRDFDKKKINGKTILL